MNASLLYCLNITPFPTLHDNHVWLILSKIKSSQYLHIMSFDIYREQINMFIRKVLVEQLGQCGRANLTDRFEIWMNLTQ